MALLDVDDIRLAEKTILQQWFDRKFRRRAERQAVSIHARAAHATICQLEADGFRFSHIKGDNWWYVKDIH